MGLERSGMRALAPAPNCSGGTGGGRVVGRTPAGPDTGRTNKTLMARIASLLLTNTVLLVVYPGFEWYLGVYLSVS